MNSFILFLCLAGLSFFFWNKSKLSNPIVKSPAQVDLPNVVLKKAKVKKNLTITNQLGDIVPETSEVPSKSTPEPSSKIGNFEKVNSSPRLTKLKDGHVMFEVKMKDWAVVYGDVLLGKLKSQNEIKIGQYKPKAPQLWPSADIPYAIAKDYPYPDLIERVIDYFHNNTPIRFIPINNQKDGLLFVFGDEHCYSYLGRVGGLQPIFLSEPCREKQITHEIMHALGFVHEQSRVDRDKFVKILWDNIKPDFDLQFLKVPKSFMIANGSFDFDYQSVMMYEPTAFAAQQGLNTIQSLSSEDIQPVQNGLSAGDLDRLYKVYGEE